MRALTLTQPYGALVVEPAAESDGAVKTLENRNRGIIGRKDWGVPFGIHASREVDRSVWNRVERDMKIPSTPLWEVTSAIIGIAVVDGMVRSEDELYQHYLRRALTVKRLQGDGAEHDALVAFARARQWFTGPIVYVLRDQRALATPVPCRGWRGFWTMTDDVAGLVQVQL
jgi:hypothetical protein